MKKAKFKRIDNIITNLETGKAEKYSSVNLAKKRSKHIQMINDGAIGRGSVITYK